MPRLRFDAWVNGLSGTDPGHMAMLDEAGGFYYEYAWAMPPPTPNVLGLAGSDEKWSSTRASFKTRNVMTQDLEEKPSRTLVPLRDRKEVYFRRQLMKTATPRTTTFRFTHMFYIEVDVTQGEYDYLMLLYAFRRVFGSYSFFKEAKVLDPFATRCLSFLEDLVAKRGQRLATGTALAVMISFVQLNVGVQLQVDPLIAH